MAIVRWQPLYELNTLSREMNRLFEQLPQLNVDTPDLLNQGNGWVPAVEVKETESEIVLRAEVPGLRAENLDVQVTRSAVSISGEHRYEKQAEDKGYFHSEFRYGKFQRIVPLPSKVENEQVKAEFKDGILTLTLPKAADERRQVFRVNLSQPQPDQLENGQG
jgi:HSP20 family protein